MNKLRPELHRQAALNGLNGVNPSSHAIPGLEQSHSPPRLGQRPGSCQTGNSRANHNGVEGIGSMACHAHLLHLPSECLGTRAFDRHRMLERLDG